MKASSWLIILLTIGPEQCLHAQGELFQIEDYLIDDQHSYIGFKIKYFGFSPVRGRFNSFRGHMLYDSSDIAKTSATLFIDVKSINTGVKMRDDDLTGTHWFDSEQFPHISFRSTSVTKRQNGFQVRGLLQIKSKIDTVSINFEPPTKISRDFSGNKQVDFSGHLQIKRSDFGIEGEGFWNSLMDGKLQQLSNEVDIELDIHCRRPDYLHRHEASDTSDIRKKFVRWMEGASADKQDELLDKFNSDSVRDLNKLTSGAVSTIGYTLLAKKKPNLARKVFERKLQWYPESSTTQIALAKTAALAGDFETTNTHLELSLVKDSSDTRALELLRILQ